MKIIKPKGQAIYIIKRKPEKKRKSECRLDSCTRLELHSFRSLREKKYNQDERVVLIDQIQIQKHLKGKKKERERRMALKFLNKKGWHTGSLRNIENVWKAEQKHEAEQKKLDELRKQILEERERSEFRQLQEQAGLVP